MSLQYISDSSGKITGVFLPIDEWNELKKKYQDIEQTVEQVPEWHINMVQERVVEYKRNPTQVLDADSAIDEIEKEL
jgi:hypothetical protein